MFVTVAAVLAIDILLGAVIGYIFSQPSLTPLELTTNAQSVATHITEPLSAPPPTTATTSQLVKTLKPLLNSRISAAVTDRKGEVITWVPEWVGKNRTSLFPQAPFVVKSLARAAVSDKVSPEHLSAQDIDGSSLAVVPIYGKNQQVHGLLYLKMPAPVKWRDFSGALFKLMVASALIVMPFAAVVGLGFGFLNARRLVKRLKVITDAADAWSQGQFSVMAYDNSADEVGQLARRLNQMAVELRELVALRQNLAASEERNRLSRELHDTVKQHIFATTMQVGAARMLLDRDVNLARARLVEVEHLAGTAQQELTLILEQLRPSFSVSVRPAIGDLGDSLRAYARHWSGQSGIAADVFVESIPTVSENISHSLFRITQEALTNVSRHSRATKVLVSLEMSPTEQERDSSTAMSQQNIKLVIQDNGQGFDPLHAGGGFGLQSMRERSQELPRGTFIVESQVGYGTCIEVTCNAI